MKHTHTITEVKESSSVVLRDVDIDGKKYVVVIGNLNGHFWLKFDKESPNTEDAVVEKWAKDDGEFYIGIGEKGIQMCRCVHRPGHDHDDTEYLTQSKDGLGWSTKLTETLWIPFGSELRPEFSE